MSNLPLVRPLDEFPVKDGFRLRGCDMTRIETFTDASFAFAVTLLVVSIDAIPSSFEELTRALMGAPAFAISFLLLMMFWHGHWTWSRRYGLEDNTTIFLSCLLVFVMLCFVYPLKFLLTGMVVYLTGGALPGSISLNGVGQLYQVFAIYGGIFVAMTLVIILLNVHAYRQRHALKLSELELFDTKAEIGSWSILASVGIVSVVLALVLTPSPWAIPGHAYSSLAILMPFNGIRISRLRRVRFGEDLVKIQSS